MCGPEDDETTEEVSSGPTGGLWDSLGGAVGDIVDFFVPPNSNHEPEPVDEEEEG